MGSKLYITLTASTTSARRKSKSLKCGFAGFWFLSSYFNVFLFSLIIIFLFVFMIFDKEKIWILKMFVLGINYQFLAFLMMHKIL